MSKEEWPIEEDPIFACWLWTAKLDKDGYGVSWHDGRARRAHIAVWEETNGPVKEGHVLEHACRRRNCVALHHLEVVTQRENLFRRSWSYRARIKSCPRGHDLSLHAAVTPEGGRTCRLCNRGEP